MKKLLITGGSSDVAFAIINDLDAEYEVTYTCSSKESLIVNQEKYKEFNARGIVHNFKDDKFNESFDIIVLNACSKVNKLARLNELDTHQELEYVHDNLKGNLTVIKASLERMSEKRFGRIVFISSVSTLTGTAKYSSYVMLKSALEGLMTNIAVEYGQSNIMANSIRLGIFKTSRTKMIWKREAYQEYMNSQILAGRLGVPDEVVAPVRMLIAEKSYITGTKFEVSGGLPIPNTGNI